MYLKDLQRSIMRKQMRLGMHRTDSIIDDYTDGKRCYLTGYVGVGLDLHHIFNGAKRSWSDKNGTWVYLRHDVHMEIHQRRPDVAIELKKIAQEKWEQLHRDDYDDVRAEFIKQVGKSYV